MKKITSEENKKVLHLKNAFINLEAETRGKSQKVSLTRPVTNKFLGIKQLKESKVIVGNSSQISKKPAVQPNSMAVQAVSKDKPAESKPVAKISYITPTPFMNQLSSMPAKPAPLGSGKKSAFRTKLIHPQSGKQKVGGIPRSKANEVNLSLREIKRNPTFSPSSERERLAVDLRKSKEMQPDPLSKEKNKSDTIVVQNFLAKKNTVETKRDSVEGSEKKLVSNSIKAPPQEQAREIQTKKFSVDINVLTAEQTPSDDNKLDTLLSDGALKEFSFLNGSNVVIYSDNFDPSLNGKNPIDELEKFLTKFKAREVSLQDYEEFFKLNPMDIKGSVLYEETLLLIGEQQADVITNSVLESNEPDAPSDEFNDKIVACLLNGVEDAAYYEGYLEELIRLFKIGVWRTKKQIALMWTFLNRMSPKVFLIAESKREFLAEIFLRLLVHMRNFRIEPENVSKYIFVTENLLKDFYIRQQIKTSEAVVIYNEKFEKEMQRLLETENVSFIQALEEIELVYYISAVSKYYEFVEEKKFIKERLLLLLRFSGEYLKAVGTLQPETPTKLLAEQIKINIKKIIGCYKFYEKGVFSKQVLEEILINDPPKNLKGSEFLTSLQKKLKKILEIS